MTAPVDLPATRARLDAVDRGSVFVVVWAVANIVHLLNQTNGDLPFPTSWLNLAVAVWVLGRPSSAHRLATLAAAQLLDSVWLAPFVPDHQVLAAFVNVAILVAYAVMQRPASSERLVDRVAPGAKLLVLIAYGSAAIAKYNTDFLDPLRSCAVFVADNASYGLVGPDTPFPRVHIWASLVIETLVPIVLIIPRTRRWGALFAAAFHFVVSLSPAIAVADFTLLLWPLFMLFLPDRDVDAIGRHIVSAIRRSPSIVRYDRVPRWVFGAAFVAFVAALGRTGPAVYLFVWLFSTLAGFWVVVTSFGVIRTNPPDVQPFGRPTAAQILLAVVLVTHVSGAYLGFGTSSRFTMFSGIRTEGPGTNHLFLPSVHLIGSQNDWLIVIRANDESDALVLAADARAAVPVVELRRVLGDDAVSATFETPDGRRIAVAAGEDHPLRDPPPWWESKTQHYRPFKVEGTDPEYCSN